jgi:hypothetical protein
MRGGSLIFEDLETYRLWGETLRLICAFFWGTTYVLVIRRGNKDQLPAMPLAALALNISWEGIFSFLYMPDDSRVLAAWGGCFVLDVFILHQVYRYGSRDFPQPWVQKHWNTILGLSLVTAFVALMGFTAQFGDKLGWFTGFIQNLIMSILFVAMIIRRDSVKGQSLYIALTKFLGTFVAFLLALRWAPAFGTAVVEPRLRATRSSLSSMCSTSASSIKNASTKASTHGADGSRGARGKEPHGSSPTLRDS